MSEREPIPERNAKPEKLELWQRMYTRKHLIDLVRMVGYAGLPLDKAREGIKEMEHDKEKLVAGCEELFDIDGKEVKLKAHVRKLAWQLLGAPPEYVETPIAEMVGKQEVRADKPQEKAKKKRSTREKSKIADATVTSPHTKADNRRAQPAQTPIMDQYRAAKEKHPGMILLFRLGDFYEVFNEDADTVHKLLGLTLTTRDRTTKMAGFPHHHLEVYLHKLLKEGQRVAICEPVEDATGRAPIKREVQRVIVPEDGEFSDDAA